MTEEKKPKPRGFAAMSKEAVRAISSKGGVAAHEQGVAHKFEKGSEKAKAAGRKGGMAPHRTRGKVRGEESPASSTQVRDDSKGTERAASGT